MNAKPLIIDPEFRDLIPPLAPEELENLHNSLSADGCLCPLIVWRETGILIDGHNRHAFLTKHGKDIPLKDVSFYDRKEAMTFAILNQVGRRNVDPDTASMLRGLLYNGAKKQQGGTGANQHAQKDQSDTSANTAATIAKQTGVSAPTIKRDAKFASALEKLGLTIGEFKASGKGRKDILAEAFPPKAKVSAPVPDDPEHEPAPLVIDGTKPSPLTPYEAKRLTELEATVDGAVADLANNGMVLPTIRAMLGQLSAAELSELALESHRLLAGFGAFASRGAVDHAISAMDAINAGCYWETPSLFRYIESRFSVRITKRTIKTTTE